MNDIKNKVRREIRAMKQDLTDIEKKSASDKVFLMIHTLAEWRDSKNILMYYSLPDELSTIQYLKSCHKNIYLPKVNGDNLEIIAYNESAIEQGAYNINEPTNISDVLSPDKLDLVIVPGVAFDREMNRLGRGKGFYDRLLTETSAVKIGIGYDFQLVDLLPSEPHDIKMDIIVTPSNILRK